MSYTGALANVKHEQSSLSNCIEIRFRVCTLFLPSKPNITISKEYTKRDSYFSFDVFSLEFHLEDECHI